MAIAALRAHETSHPGDLKRRTCFLVAGSVRQQTRFWVVECLEHNWLLRIGLGPSLEVQTLETGIDPAEYSLWLGVSFAWEWEPFWDDPNGAFVLYGTACGQHAILKNDDHLVGF